MADKSDEVLSRTLEETRRYRITRRHVMQGAVASAAALAATWKPREVRADVSGSVNVYTSSGLRWEGSMRAALPLFEQVYPNIDVNFVAEPIGETFPKINVMMESQIDTFNVIYTDYGQWPSMYVKEALTPLQPFADQDPAWFEDYLNDVPREISKLYRVPPEQDGELYGLTPDGNALLATYRKDVLDKHGISYPETFDEWIEAAKEVHDPDNEVYAYCASLQRGAWFGFNFWAALAAHGGSWFDRMEKGYWNPTFNTEAGYLALKAMKELQAYAHPVTSNATEDEVNRAFANGSAILGPNTWGTAVLNKPEYSKFPEEFHWDVPPRGSNPEGVHKALTGGLGQFIPPWSADHQAAWEWIKWINSGDMTDPRIGQAMVEAGGQPSRVSLLSKYADQRNFFKGLAKAIQVATPYLMLVPEAIPLVSAFGEEGADYVNDQKDIEDALEAMDRRCRRIMEDSGYYDD